MANSLLESEPLEKWAVTVELYVSIELYTRWKHGGQ